MNKLVIFLVLCVAGIGVLFTQYKQPIVTNKKRSPHVQNQNENNPTIAPTVPTTMPIANEVSTASPMPQEQVTPEPEVNLTFKEIRWEKPSIGDMQPSEAKDLFLKRYIGKKFEAQMSHVFLARIEGGPLEKYSGDFAEAVKHFLMDHPELSADLPEDAVYVLRQLKKAGQYVIATIEAEKKGVVLSGNKMIFFNVGDDGKAKSFTQYTSSFRYSKGSSDCSEIDIKDVRAIITNLFGNKQVAFTQESTEWLQTSKGKFIRVWNIKFLFKQVIGEPLKFATRISACDASFISYPQLESTMPPLNSIDNSLPPTPTPLPRVQLKNGIPQI